MTTRPEPEREMVGRMAPFGPPAVALAFGVGFLVRGLDAGLSAAIGVAIVYVNFVVHGLSLARAARVSLIALGGVAVIGFVVRLGAIVGIMALLNQFDFFSPLAFGLAVVPATVALLTFEMRLLAGGLGAELHLPAGPGKASL